MAVLGVFVIWAPNDEQGHVKETVRLKVAKGIAGRFRLVSFHDFQQIEMLPSGEATVLSRLKVSARCSLGLRTGDQTWKFWNPDGCGKHLWPMWRVCWSSTNS